jgi:hypothetical protein
MSPLNYILAMSLIREWITDLLFLPGVIVKWVWWYNVACLWKISVLDDLGTSVYPNDGSSMIIWNFTAFIPVYVCTWPHITGDKRQVWRVNCTISQCPDSFSVMYVRACVCVCVCEREREKTVHDRNINLGHCYCSSHFPWFLCVCVCVCVCEWVSLYVTEKESEKKCRSFVEVINYKWQKLLD